MSGRYTPSVVAALAQTGSTSAQQVFAVLRAAGERIGLSTVYRELRALAVDGRVVAVAIGQETFYQLRDETVVDGLLCTVCGRTRLLPRSATPLSEMLASASPFLSPDAPVVVQGTCRDCITTRR